jgi:hypothetical protein
VDQNINVNQTVRDESGRRCLARSRSWRRSLGPVQALLGGPRAAAPVVDAEFSEVKDD